MTTPPSARPRWLSFRGPWLWFVPLTFFAVVATLEATHAWIGYRLAGEPAIGMTLRGQRLTWTALLARTLPSWLVLGMLTPLVVMAVRRVPLTAANWRRAVPIHIAFAALFAATFLVCASLLRHNLFLRQETGAAWASLLARYYAVYFNTFFLNYWALLAAYSAFRHHEQNRRTLLLEKRLAEARLQSLQAQLRPHFLFNALNAISTLARAGDRRTVVRMLAVLSDLLRASFRTPAAQVIPLREELELTGRYLELERLRFSDRLTVNVTTSGDDALDAAVPPFVLQPLVENALRHGIAASAGPGRVDIDAVRVNGTLELRVRDTGPGPPSTPVEAGTGLRNTRGRLAQLYADAASLDLIAAEDGGALAIVRLPYTRAETESP